MNKKINTKTVILIVGVFVLLGLMLLLKPRNFLTDFIDLQVLHKDTSISVGVYGHVKRNGNGVSTKINIKDLAFAHEYSVTSGLDGFYQIELPAGDYSVIPEAADTRLCSIENSGYMNNGFTQTLSSTCKAEVREAAILKDFNI